MRWLDSKAWVVLGALMVLASIGGAAWAASLCDDDCAWEGRCERLGEQCVATREEACRLSAQCSMSGHCRLDATRQQCVQAAQDPCQDSPACESEGACFFNGQCVDGAMWCRMGARCTHEGACRFDAERQLCVVSPEGCRESYACAEAGVCDYDAATQRCVAGADACRHSEACASSGRCLLVAGRCVAGSAEDCAASAACRDGGACHLRGEGCVVLESADCAASTRCAQLGHCFAVDAQGQVTAESGAIRGCGHGGRCDALEVCRRWGRCGVVEGRCAPVRDEDCQKSEACSRDGACHRIAASPGVFGQGPRCGAKSDEDCVGKCGGKTPCRFELGMGGAGGCHSGTMMEHGVGAMEWGWT